jgi:glycosyltransferase involved in cell wall biosynthesis
VFKPCALIPVYNHSDHIASVVQQLRLLQLPCIILDDGSDASCQSRLEEVAGSDEGITLIRFDNNRGKGAVVCDGLLHVYQKGYSHALQIDADGQHDLADVPAFLERGKQNLTAVISGRRNYNQLPGSRRYGRFITDLWVWINTLSLQIKDSMCGYRLYPLALTADLLSSESIGQRMDFDTDIMVRLFWRGVPVEHITTQIHYGDEITSHFNLIKDNVRISRMHARLFFGMLIRFPTLLLRRKHNRR